MLAARGESAAWRPFSTCGDEGFSSDVLAAAKTQLAARGYWPPSRRPRTPSPTVRFHD